jgi:hypothetical protein
MEIQVMFKRIASQTGKYQTEFLEYIKFFIFTLIFPLAVLFTQKLIDYPFFGSGHFQIDWETVIGLRTVYRMTADSRPPSLPKKNWLRSSTPLTILAASPTATCLGKRTECPQNKEEGSAYLRTTYNIQRKQETAGSVLLATHFYLSFDGPK